MKKRILTEDDLRNIENSIEDIDINQFDAIDKDSQNFNTLREPGIFRLWNSSTSPSGTHADYIMAVYKHNNNVIQVAHSSTNASSTRNKVYVRSYYNNTWSSWRELTNTEIEKEIDKVKQSGVESNKILVDALNSKKVSASTSDSIRTNVNKVKDIHIGDYSIGDYVPYSKLDISLTKSGLPVQIFEKDITKPTAVAITDNYIYAGNDEGRLYKLRLDGTTVWNKLISSSSITAIDTDGDRYIYIGLYNGEFKKINSSGGVTWTRKVSDGWRPSNLTFKDGYIYTKTPSELRKTSENGSTQWLTNEYRTNSQIAVDDDGYIYISGDSTGTSHPRYLYKISPAGKTVTSQDIYRQYVGGVCVSDGRVFTSEKYSFFQLDNNLTEKIKQPIEVLTNEIHKLKPDENGSYIYGISGNYAVKVSKWGGVVWRVWQGDNLKDIDYNNGRVVTAKENAIEVFGSMGIFGVYLK